MSRYLLLTTTAGFLLPGTAFAQDTQAQPGSISAAFENEIIVTATKKANGENVQDAVIAITAYGAEQLAGRLSAEGYAVRASHRDVER